MESTHLFLRAHGACLSVYRALSRKYKAILNRYNALLNVCMRIDEINILHSLNHQRFYSWTNKRAFLCVVHLIKRIHPPSSPEQKKGKTSFRKCVHVSK